MKKFVSSGLLMLSFWANLTIPALAQNAAPSGKPAGLPDLSTAIVEVARTTIPAVVHIEVTETQEVTNPLGSLSNDPFFRGFFDVPKMPKKFKQELKGLGTGMIFDDTGHILTNNHVVSGASKIQVLLADGSEYAATVAGTDPKTDLAVITIQPKGTLPHVTFGDSDQVEVGQWVVAIGHPRGLDQTVTQGIISAKHRRGITDPNSYQDFLQTDAAINPGNSGGPLLNLRGEVIGVNSAIASDSGGFEGIGFTIPSNMAQYIARELIAKGKVIRGWLGVSVQDLTADLAGSFHATGTKGALVADVAKNSPAEKAGIKRGDIITVINGKPVTDASFLRNEVANTPINQDIPIGIVRDGKTMTIQVKIGNLEEQTQALTAALKERIGATVRPPTEQESDSFGLDPQVGVVVQSLDPKGPLGKAGFEAGDMILAINNDPVKGLDGFITLISSMPRGQRITILALDHKSGQTGYVRVLLK